MEANTKDYPWKSSPKPCRFLVCRVYDSDITGIPSGVEETCTNDVYGNIDQLDVLVHSLEKLLTDPMYLSRIPHALVLPDTHEKGLADILKKMRKTIAEIKNKHQVSRDRRYSKTNEEAAKEHLSEQLGGIANSPLGGQLMDWLLGKGEENDSR